MDNCTAFGGRCTVKVNGKARHPERMTQVQNIRVSKKVIGIPDKNFTTNIELFRQTFTDVVLLQRAKNGKNPRKQPKSLRIFYCLP
jgi:hypothetical protein